jgi:hypothetical protein
MVTTGLTYPSRRRFPATHVDRSWLIGVASLIAIATILRLAGFAYDRPFVFHPDEWAIVKPALLIAATGDPNPHLFYYGALLPSVDAAVSLIIHALTGAPLSTPSAGGAIAGLAATFDSDFPVAQYDYVVGARLVVIAMGVVTVPLVLAAAQRLGASRGASFVAGAIAALAPILVVNGRMAMTDVPTTMWCAASILSATGFDGRTPKRALVASAVFAGLAGGTKWNTVIVAIIPLALALGATRPERIRAVVLVVIGVLTGLLVASPWIVLDPSEVVAGVAIIAAIYPGSHPGAEGGAPVFYAVSMFRDLGPIVLAFGITGLAVSLRDRPALRAVALFTVVDLVFISLPNTRFERNLAPTVPAVAVLAAVGVDRLGSIGRKPAIVASVLALMWLAGVSAWDTRDLLRTDSRIAAGGWIEAHLPAGTVIAREPYTPQPDTSRYRVTAVPALWVRSTDWLRTNGFDVAILSSFFDDRFNQDYPIQAAAYERLRHLPVLYQTPPDAAGPRITIVATR